MVMNETYLKAKILTTGVVFSEKALEYAKNSNAKGQNLVYNAPSCLESYRPQELHVSHKDGYETVVSCVSPCSNEPVFIDVANNELIAMVDGKVVNDILIKFVIEPSYYKKRISRERLVKEYVSACGYDELNILPWKGCAISKGCLFCGTNTIAKMNSSEILNAFSVSNFNAWETNKQVYIRNLKKAICIAKQEKCYSEHMHVIIISGDLCDEKLDYQSVIYSEIASAIKSDVADKTTEGIVAVLMPPKNSDLLHKLYESGISKVVFNLEVGDEKLFNKYCPGKSNIGYDHIISSLHKSVDIFGRGNVWTNFVLGLEPIDKLLELNASFAKAGIVSSANVLHIDKGNRLDCGVPNYQTVIRYYYELSKILKRNNQKPFYCSKALRTSLSNEAYEGRIEV